MKMLNGNDWKRSRRYSKISNLSALVIINVAIIFVEIIICCIIISINDLKVNGPFHLSTIVETGKCVVVNGKDYKIYSNKITDMNEQVKMYDFDFFNDYEIYKMSNSLISYDICDTQIYLCTIHGIIVLDSNLKVVDTLAHINIKSMLVKNNIIHLVYWQKDDIFVLKRLDKKLKTLTEESIEKANTYVSQYRIIIDSKYNLVDIDDYNLSINNNFSIEYLVDNANRKIEYIYDTKILSINDVIINDLDAIQGNNVCSDLTIHNNWLYFATYEYVNNNCNYKCICHYKNFQIFKYDLVNDLLTKISDLPQKSYFIGFYNDSYRYYYSSKLYIDDFPVTDCINLEPGGEYYCNYDTEYCNLLNITYSIDSFWFTYIPNYKIY